MIRQRGGQAPRATVVELRAEIKRLEAELWKARHTAELEERKQADPERSLAAALAFIDRFERCGGIGAVVALEGFGVGARR